jgi:endonuclease/exonuclease/phosphatase family metal-dependent hydrolase
MRPPRPRARRRGVCACAAYALTVCLAALALVSLALAGALALLPPARAAGAAAAAARAPAAALRYRRSAHLRARVMSFNVRNIHNVSGHNWHERVDAVASAIAAASPDAVGLQEASRSQLDDLLARLPGYAAVAHGRRGRNESETAAVLYDARALTLLAARTFWLSEAPGEVGSVARAWGSQLPRVATVAALAPLHRSAAGAGARAYGRTPFHFINTHLDHEGAAARLHGAELVAAAAQAAAAGAGAGAGAGVAEALPPLPAPLRGAPCIVTGDFNSGPGDAPAAVLAAAGFVDVLAAQGGAKEAGTFHNFTGAALAGVPRIDYVLASRGGGGCRLSGRAWVDAAQRLGVWPSDHFAVVADVAWEDEGGAGGGGGGGACGGAAAGALR